ncbi:hypothetical protein K439DRAFT_1385418 [Ramaria rubella]|nr:hypothetical protein K439DRAFT_1385418 [Ramaria rubella]
MIGGIDNMWLLLGEVADFNPVCAATYTLGAKLSLKELEKTAFRLANKFPKYKQKLISLGRNWHGPHFVTDPCFDLKKHVHVATLPHPAGEAELNEFMGMFIAQEWDFACPLWEMVLLENYHDEDGAKCAVVTRAHHTLADGQGFVLSQLYMTSYYDELLETMNNGAATLRAAKHGLIYPSRLHKSLRPLDPLARNTITAPLIRLVLVLIYWSSAIFSFFVSLFWSTYQAVHQIFLFILTCWRVNMLTADYQGPRVTGREFSISKVFDMEDIKLCQRAFSGPRPFGVLRALQRKSRTNYGSFRHVTLNDVVCSIMADILGEELLNKNQKSNGMNTLKNVLPSPIGFFIPISVRKPGDWSMRNQSTGSTVYLNPSKSLTRSTPIQELYEHIHACRSELSLLKHSLWPRLFFDLVQLTGQAPITWPVPFALVPRLFFESVRNNIRDWITLPMIRLSLESVPVILTNVPGPSKPIKLSGADILKWTALPPQAGKGNIGIGVISYAGGICISVAADKVTASEGVASRICMRFAERFELYVARAKEILLHEE